MKKQFKVIKIYLSIKIFFLIHTHTCFDVLMSVTFNEQAKSICQVLVHAI